MGKSRVVQTNYAVNLSEFTDEWLEETGVTLEQVASDMLGDPAENLPALQNLFKPAEPIDEDHALSLASITGIPAKTWLAIDALYWSDMKRLGKL